MALAQQALSQNFPNSTAAFINLDIRDGDGKLIESAGGTPGTLTQAGQYLLQSLWARTGSGGGASTPEAIALAQAAQATAAAAQAGANASLKIALDLADLHSIPTARNNLGLGSIALGNTTPGWSTPTGAGSRASINGTFSQTINALYSQTQVQALSDQVKALSAALAQVILDLENSKVLSA